MKNIARFAFLGLLIALLPGCMSVGTIRRPGHSCFYMAPNFGGDINDYLERGGQGGGGYMGAPLIIHQGPAGFVPHNQQVYQIPPPSGPMFFGGHSEPIR